MFFSYPLRRIRTPFESNRRVYYWQKSEHQTVFKEWKMVVVAAWQQWQTSSGRRWSVLDMPPSPRAREGPLSCTSLLLLVLDTMPSGSLPANLHTLCFPCFTAVFFFWFNSVWGYERKQFGFWNSLLLLWGLLCVGHERVVAICNSRNKKENKKCTTKRGGNVKIINIY